MVQNTFEILREVGNLSGLHSQDQLGQDFEICESKEDIISLNNKIGRSMAFRNGMASYFPIMSPIYV